MRRPLFKGQELRHQTHHQIHNSLFENPGFLFVVPGRKAEARGLETEEPPLEASKEVVGDCLRPEDTSIHPHFSQQVFSFPVFKIFIMAY